MEHHVEGLLRGGKFKDLLDVYSLKTREKYNLRKIDIEVLFYLYRSQENNTAKDIQKNLNMNKGYISQVLDNLCRLGYINAVTDKEDRRYVHYIVTDKTEQVAMDIQEVWDSMSEQLFKGITEEEKKVLRKVAKVMNQNMMEMLNK